VDAETFSKNVLGLRTNPFLPQIGPDNKPIVTKVIEPSLNPAADDRVLHYYFDVYDWRESLLIRGVSREDALMTFPQPGDLAGDPTLLVMISGNSQTGRDSLANLVVHKIKRATNEKPVVVSVRLGFDAKSNALNTATLFVDAFEIDADASKPNTDAVARMRARIKQTTEAPPADGNYSNLFMGLRQMYDQVASRPIVIRALEGDHASWAQMYDATRDLASFLIVTTGDPVNAEACYLRMHTAGKNIAWVRAGLLDLPSCRRYVSQRLAEERGPQQQPGANDIAPFTDDALELLFKPGATAANGTVQRQSIGFLRRRLRRALEEAARTTESVIDAVVMRRACDALNRGN
jgi:hypothetical protein